MKIPEISPDWTPNERLSMIHFLAAKRIEKIQNGGVFSAIDYIDLLNIIDMIISQSSYFLNNNRDRLFKDMKDF